MLATQEIVDSNGRRHNRLLASGVRDLTSLTWHWTHYQKWADKVEAGFEAAAKYLHSQYVFTEHNVPYNTQVVPLAGLCVELGAELESANAKAKLERWYWSGVFGEAYGSAVETQYARDLVGSR